MLFKYVNSLIKFKFAISLCLFFIQSTSNIALAQRVEGGTSGAGGGNGIVCYANGKEHIPDNREKTVVLEYWEESFYNSKFQNYDLIATFNNHDPSEFLIEMIARIYGKISPHFSKTLVSAIKEVSSQINNCNNFPPIRDHGKMWQNEFEIVKELNCDLIGLARRLPTLQPNGEPNFRFEFNCNEYKELGDGSSASRFINQTYLILHEALYLIVARLKTHSDSMQVRQMTLFILNQTEKILRKWQLLKSDIVYNLRKEKADFRRQLRTYGFDDFFRLSGNCVDRQDQQKCSRQKIYQDLSDVLDRQVRKTLKFSTTGGQFRSAKFLVDPESRFLQNMGIGFGPFPKAMSSIYINEVVPALTPDQAFVFYASIFAIEESMIGGADGDYDFESLFLVGVDDSQTVQLICDYAKDNFNIYQSNLIYNLTPKVRDYCSKKF